MYKIPVAGDGCSEADKEGVRPRGVNIWHPAELNREEDPHYIGTEKFPFAAYRPQV